MVIVNKILDPGFNKWSVWLGVKEEKVLYIYEENGLSTIVFSDGIRDICKEDINTLEKLFSKFVAFTSNGWKVLVNKDNVKNIEDRDPFTIIRFEGKECVWVKEEFYDVFDKLEM